jgi:TatD DNase family protein
VLIDTHSHLDRYLLHKRFGQNIDPVLQQIEEYEILTISNSMDLTSHKANCRIARNSKYVIPAFGIHPWNAHKYLDKIELIEKLIGRTEIVGEIGLDYFYIKDKDKYPAQRTIFSLFLSKSKNKILSIHTKGAEKDVLDLLKEYGNRRVIVHWFSGSLDVLDEMIEERYYFSVVPEIKFSDHIQKIVKKIPMAQILTETDNPGGPESYMGKKGMPILIRDVIEGIAKVKGKSLEQVERTVQNNFVRLIEPLPGLRSKTYDMIPESP